MDLVPGGHDLLLVEQDGDLSDLSAKGGVMNDNVCPENARQAIMDAAAECFSKKTVRRTTYADIAAISGCDARQIKKEFKTKNQLALTIQARDMKRMKQAYLSSMPDATPDKVIKYILRTRLNFVADNHERMYLFFREGLSGHQPWSKMLDKVIWDLSIELLTLIHKGVRDGLFRQSMDENIITRSILSHYLTGVVVIGLRSEEFDADGVWDFIEPQIDMLFECITT